MTFYENITVNPFHVTDLFLYPLKISENFWFSDISCLPSYKNKPILTDV